MKKGKALGTRLYQQLLGLLVRSNNEREQVDIVKIAGNGMVKVHNFVHKRAEFSFLYAFPT